MTERTFRLMIGACLLAILYFDLTVVMPVLLSILLLEGLANWRIPVLLQRLRPAGQPAFEDSSEFMPLSHKPRFAFDAERAWRIAVVVMLALTFYAFPEQFWFFPWFMGFAIFGAGLSGVCPVLISLKLLGFR